jgi:hypothetical protein
MKQGLYAIFDRASGVYDGPLRGQADGVVIRQFCDLAVGDDHPVAQHPEDYTLFKIGEFNDGTGELEPMVPEKLINGGEAVSQSRKVNGAHLEEVDKEISANA